MNNEEKSSKGVSLKALVAVIVIGGIILGFLIVSLVKSFSNSMNQYYTPITKEQSYLNKL